MKTRLFIIILFTLILTTYSYSAECPRGFSQTVVPVYVNNCLYWVHVCYRCTEEQGDNREVRVWGFVPDDPECAPWFDPNAIMEEIYNQIYTAQFFQNLCGTIPSCDNNDGVEVWYVYEKCWEKYNNNGVIEYRTCSYQNCYCSKFRIYCWRNGEWIIWQESDWIFSCYENCTTVYTAVPDPPIGESSDCFYLWTPCNP